jgi:hypothetical protein
MIFDESIKTLLNFFTSSLNKERECFVIDYTNCELTNYLCCQKRYNSVIYEFGVGREVRALIIPSPHKILLKATLPPAKIQKI